MAYTMSGNMQVSISPTANITAGAQVLAAYSIPLGMTPIQQFAIADGSGSGQVHKALVFSGTIPTNTTPAVIAGANLTSGLGVDGAALALAHVRAFIICNDGNSAGFATTDANILIWDLTVVNSWGIGTGTAGLFGTATKIYVPAGTCYTIVKPWGSVGWTVTAATADAIALGTPAGNANTIAYRLLVLGD